MEDPQLVCSECGQILKGTSGLSRHYLDHHDPLQEYCCGQNGCEKKFMHKTSMIRHMKCHIGGQPSTSQFPGRNDCLEHPLPEFGCPSNDVSERHEDYVMGGTDEDDAGITLPPPRSIAEVMQEEAARMTLSLRASPGMTGSAVERIQQHVESIIKLYSSQLKEKVDIWLSSEGVTADRKSDVLKLFDSGNPFEGIQKIDDQLNVFERKYGLVKPEKKYLGYRIDQRLDSLSNTFVPTQVSESFHYVSFMGTLRTILANPSQRKKILRKLESDDDVLRSHVDGAFFRNHPFLVGRDNVLHILLYYDDLETTNSQGSKTVIHKLGAFLFQILNLPTEDLSELSSVHLLALAHSDDMKVDGAFEKVLTPFLQDMKRLSGEGMEIDIDGGKITVYAFLVALTADTLAAHEVLGLLSPSAKYFCRQCMISRSELREDSNTTAEPRTQELHAEHINKVKIRATFSSSCGVKRDTPLRQFPYFDITKQCVFDAFHDFLEGIVPLDLKLVLREFIYVRQLLSVLDLNANISSFSYGVPDSKNKPSPNFTLDLLTKRGEKLKQTGSQMWCLLRAFPFLLKVDVPERDEHMQLIFLLQDIAQIVFSPAVRHTDIDRFEFLMYEHNELFKKLFIDLHTDQAEVDEVHNESEEEEEGEEEEEDREDEDALDSDDVVVPRRRRNIIPIKVHMINKMHYAKHYAENARQNGPPMRMWCGKFEGRLKIFRQFASVCGNFKNIPETMAKMFQLSTLNSLLQEKGSRLDHHKSGTFKSVAQSTYCDQYVGAGLAAADTIFITNSASLNGEEYRPSLFVCLQRGPPHEFGVIMEVAVVKSTEKIYLVVNPWVNKGLSSKFHAFSVAPGNLSDLTCIQTTSLPYHRAIAPWVASNSTEICLSLRTIVL